MITDQPPAPCLPADKWSTIKLTKPTATALREASDATLVSG